VAPPSRRCAALPPGVRVLHNTCVAPGAKALAKDGLLLRVLYLDEPTDANEFDTIIINPGDYGRDQGWGDNMTDEEVLRDWSAGAAPEARGRE
jgi:hypothetical protein